MHFKLSLNRAHKVAERLKAKRNSLKTEVETLIKPTQVTLIRGMKPASLAMYSSTSKLNSALALLDNISIVLADLKIRISDANAALGINTLLAKNEAITFMYQLTEGAVSPKPIKADRFAYRDPVPDKLPMTMDDASSILLKMTEHEEAPSVEVMLERVSSSYIAEMKKQAQTIQGEMFKLADQLSDLNRNTIEIDIPDNLLTFAGL